MGEAREGGGGFLMCEREAESSIVDDLRVACAGGPRRFEIAENACRESMRSRS